MLVETTATATTPQKKYQVDLKPSEGENWSQFFRRLHYEGIKEGDAKEPRKLTTAEIAGRSGKRYQMVRNIIVQEEQKRAALELAELKKKQLADIEAKKTAK